MQSIFSLHLLPVVEVLIRGMSHIFKERSMIVSKSELPFLLVIFKMMLTP